MMIITPSKNVAKRRRLTLGATVLLCLIVSDLLVRRADPLLKVYDVFAYNNDDFDRKPSMLKRMALPEIVLMGSSRVRYALVPSEFEAVLRHSAYNLGMNGAQTVEWMVLSRDLFSKRKPKLVILGLNAGEFRADYDPSVAARYLFGWNDFVESMAVDGPSMRIIMPFLRHLIGPSWAAYERRLEMKMWGQAKMGRWLPDWGKAPRRLRERIARLDPYSDMMGPPKGYDHPSLHGMILHNFDRYAGSYVTSEPAFSRDAIPFRRLEQLLNWFQQQRIPVTVTYLPNSPQTEKRWLGVEQKIIEAIASISHASSAAFLRLPQSVLPRTNQDYLDEVHVGYELAQRISRQVAGYIKENVPLNDEPSRLAKSLLFDSELP